MKFDLSLAWGRVRGPKAFHRGFDSRRRQMPLDDLEILTPFATTPQNIEIQVEKVMIFSTLRNLNIKTQNNALS